MELKINKLWLVDALSVRNLRKHRWTPNYRKLKGSAMKKLLKLLLNLASSLFGRKKLPQDGGDVVDNPNDEVETVDDYQPVPEEEDNTVVHQQKYTWCLDPGHGANTNGKRSPILNGQRLMEYDFNRKVLAKIASHLDKVGVDYFVTVTERNVGDFLEGRTRRANDHQSNLPKLFVSIHSNAGPASSWDDYTFDSARGMEVWHFHGSTKGQKMASIFQNFLVKATGWRNRGTKSRPDGQFYVLRKTNMPAVLTENGFYNNRFDLPLLMKDTTVETIAKAHVDAIMYIEKNSL
jgi:N-acetylmuramoyl-L-alanine amidase